MSLVRWKALCLDAADTTAAAAFWSVALGLRSERQEGGDAVLLGTDPGDGVWIDQVPEPKIGKNRVHLDLVRPDAAPLLQLGAVVLQEVHDGAAHWQVLADPEGNEFCLFDEAQNEPTALVVDSSDPAAAARWWCDVLDARLLPGPDGQMRWVGDVAGLPFDVVKFVAVPEPKTVKNRMHWDVDSEDVAALIAQGAELLRAPDDDVQWHVLADPQGNEFCVFGQS